MRGPLTVVCWDDTTNIATWIDAGDLDKLASDGGWKCENVGWITYEDEDCIVLSGRISHDEQQHVGLSERIPKRAITSRLKLSPAGDQTGPVVTDD